MSALKVIKSISTKNFIFALFNQYIGFTHNNKFTPWKWRQDLGYIKVVRK